MIFKKRARSEAEDQAALRGAIEAEPDREFTASELKTVSGVPKKYVRTALTVNGDRLIEC